MDSLGGTREAGKDQLDSLRGTREAPGKQERAICAAWEAPGRLVALDREAPGRQENTIWTAREAPGEAGSIGQPARHLGGTREVGTNHLDSLGGTREAEKDQLDSLRGTREARRTGLPIEFRFWKGARFCITCNTTSMAIGPVRGKSWGGLHGWLPVAQTGL